MRELFEQALYYLDALWRRRWQVCGIAFMTTAAVWAMIASLPDQYTSSARIFVDTQNVLRPLLRGVTVESDLNSQLAVMRQTLLSRPNLEQVARETDLHLTVTNQGGLEQLVEQLRSKIEISANRQNLFDISYTTTEPQQAHDVVQALTTLFVENNLGQNRTDIGNAQRFLQAQVQEYERKLTEAENRLARFKQENFNFLPGQSGLQEALKQEREKLEQLRGALQDARNKQRILAEELEATPQTVGQASFGASGGPPSDIQVRIVETRTQLDQLLSRYTEQHPDVVTLQRRLDRLEAELQAQQAGPGGAPAGSSSSAQVPNPVYADLRMEMIRTRSEIEALQEQVKRTEAEIAGLEERIQLVPEVEAELKRLTRDYNVIQTNYQTLLSRMESASITADRQREGSEFAFRMVESPQVPRLPSGPDRGIMLIAGLIAGLGAGGAVAWLLALINITYGSVEHLRSDFGYPVIGVFGEVHREATKVQRQGRIEVFKMILMGLLLVGSLGGLLMLESRFGLQTVSLPVYGYLGAMFALGATIFLVQLRRLQARLSGLETPGLATEPR